MNLLRTVAASLLAALLALAPTLALCAWELMQPIRMIEGQPDDAPQRAIGLILVTLPLAYVLVAIGSFLLGNALRMLRLTSARAFLLSSLALALPAGVYFGLELGAPEAFGHRDSLVSLVVAVSFFIASSAPAAMCWRHMTRSDA